MASTYTLIAQDPGPAKPADGKQAENPLGIMGSPVVMIGLILLFFFVVMWPAQRRQRKQQQQLLTNLKPGAKVVLSSGLVGTVVKVHEPEGEITLRSDDAKVRVLKSSVVSIRGEEAAAEAKS